MTKHDEPRNERIGFLATLAAVAWSFVGLRRKRDFDKDVTGLNPVYVIAGGLIGAVLFIGTLLAVVHAVVP